jgi:hypothetical protein
MMAASGNEKALMKHQWRKWPVVSKTQNNEKLEIKYRK